jgi:hypothetical protein
MTRQERAIALAQERRRQELAQLRLEIARLINEVGFREAKPVLRKYTGRPIIGGIHGGWWHYIGKRNGPLIRAELETLRPLVLFRKEEQ